MKIGERFADQAYVLFRTVCGVLFACHGAQKILGLFGGVRVGAPMLVAAGAIELVAGSLIAVGLFAAFAAFLASGEMAVAYFMSHAPHGFWPIVNHGELAVLYCFAFLFIAARGSGRWSLDALLPVVTRRRPPAGRPSASGISPIAGGEPDRSLLPAVGHPINGEMVEPATGDRA